MTRLITVCAIVVGIALPAIAQTGQQAVGTANMEILRQKIKADKKAVVAAELKLTEAEGAKFWPLYDAYQADLQQINLRLAAVILSYADAYNKGAVPDAVAKKLIEDAMAIDADEGKLKTSYIPRILAAIPAAKGARYIQIESKIRAAIRYELAAGIPLVN